MNTVWKYIGAALIIWVIRDLYTGNTYTWELIERDAEPVKYWVVVVIWALIALSCFFPWEKDKK